jgi:hypothetical protein
LTIEDGIGTPYDSEYIKDDIASAIAKLAKHTWDDSIIITDIGKSPTLQIERNGGTGEMLMWDVLREVANTLEHG